MPSVQYAAVTASRGAIALGIHLISVRDIFKTGSSSVEAAVNCVSNTSVHVTFT